MIEIQDVYISFRQAQSRCLGRPYRIPKNWDSVWQRMSKKNVECLELIMKAFNTRWQNIDMDNFFDCGFKLHGKSFTYTKFFDRRVLSLYIENDKQTKRQITNIRGSMTNSFDFILEWMKKREYSREISLYIQYCRMNEGGIRAPIKHYLMNNIDKHVLTWLINRKYLVLDDHERNMIPLIVENYRKLSREVKNTLDDEMNQYTGVEK